MLGSQIPQSVFVRIAVILATGAVLWAQAERAAVGDVLQIQGNWRIAGQTPYLLAGEGVPGGSVVQSDSGRKTDLVVVVLLSGRRLVAYCSTSPCTAKIQVPESEVQENVTFKSMLDAVGLVLLNRRPEIANAYSATSSRGVSGQRRELVIPFSSGGKVSLNSALPALRTGHYHLEIRRVSDGQFISSREVTWNRLTGLAIVLPRPGFYLVTLEDDVGSPAGDVFIAAVAEKSAGALNAQLEKAQEICARWEGPEADSSAHLFLRAYLLHIAEKQ